jgi:hypothetical protein
MKRKKTPVALITVLILTIGGLIVASSKFKVYTMSGEEQMKLVQQEEADKQRAAGPPKRADNGPKTSDAPAMRGSLARPYPEGGEAPTPKSAPGRPGAPGGKPSIVKPDTSTVAKPTRNETSTSSQWYGK